MNESKLLSLEEKLATKSNIVLDLSKRRQEELRMKNMQALQRAKENESRLATLRQQNLLEKE